MEEMDLGSGFCFFIFIFFNWINIIIFLMYKKYLFLPQILIEIYRQRF